MNPKKPKHRFDPPISRVRTRRRRQRKPLIVALLAASLTTAGIAVASQLNLAGVELGSGKIETPACFIESRVEFAYSVASGGASTVTGITVSGVSAECSGEIVSIKILDASSSTLDEIIWNPTLAARDTSMTLRADGVSTSTLNSSSDGVTTIWPDSQTAPEGLQSFTAAEVRDVQFSILAGSRSATN